MRLPAIEHPKKGSKKKTIKTGSIGEDPLTISKLKEKAKEICKQSAIQVFETPQFEGKIPFPNIEMLDVSIYFRVECDHGFDDFQHEVFSIFTNNVLAISHGFHTNFLDNTSTLKNLSLFG